MTTTDIPAGTANTEGLIEYHFRLVGDYTLDVRVFATDIYQAKGKILSEVDVVGETAQTKNRRYNRDDMSPGESWCDDGLVAFYRALALVDLGKPYYDDEYEATLFVYPLPLQSVEPRVTYRFLVRFTDVLAYEGRIVAGSLEEALYRLLEENVEFFATADSTVDFLDSDVMEVSDLEVEAAHLALLSADTTEIETSDFTVSYTIEPIEGAA